MMKLVNPRIQNPEPQNKTILWLLTLGRVVELQNKWSNIKFKETNWDWQGSSDEKSYVVQHLNFLVGEISCVSVPLLLSEK